MDWSSASTEASSSPSPPVYAPLFYSLGPFAEPSADDEPPIADGFSPMPEDNPPVILLVTTADGEYDAVKARLKPAEGYEQVLQVSVGVETKGLFLKIMNYWGDFRHTGLGAGGDPTCGQIWDLPSGAASDAPGRRQNEGDSHPGSPTRALRSFCRGHRLWLWR